MGAMNAPFKALTDFDEAWRTSSSGAQLRAIRNAAEKVREQFSAGPRCVSVTTLPLTTLAYPTKYAFWGMALSPAPFVVMSHRCLLVQFMAEGKLKNLLFNPTDVEAARETPFFKSLARQFGERMTNRFAKVGDPITLQLERIGVRPEQIDYIAFDHFHTQDLRALLPTVGHTTRPLFPNATLIAPECEWNDWDDLHPMQRAWFVREGKVGIDSKHIALTNGDLSLGDGVMLVRTPGHTSGNQTLFINTDSGVWGVSENGTCADNWSPMESKIRGLTAHCTRAEIDVVLNANTPELGAMQYTSMILERTLVDRVKRAPAFVQMFPSSEITPHLLAPGIAPTLLHRSISSGALTVKKVAA